MARRLAAGDDAGASHAQNRAFEFTLLMAIPCIAAFFVIPELIMRGLFVRGAFTDADAVAAGRTLAAYAFGLLPFVLIRSAVATFFARGDTATPVKAALIAAAVNIGFKVALMGPARAGRTGTGDLDWRLDQSYSGDLVRAARWAPFDQRLRRSIVGSRSRVSCSRRCCCCATGPSFVGRRWPAPALAALAILGAIGTAVYAGVLLAILFGRDGRGLSPQTTQLFDDSWLLPNRKVDIGVPQRYGDPVAPAMFSAGVENSNLVSSLS